jgi:hypothetical protein
MTFVLSILAACALAPGAEQDKPLTLQYLRRAGDRFVPESKVTLTRKDRGASYVSVTERGDEKTTLTLQFDDKNHVRTAEVALTGPRGKQTATLTLLDGQAQLKRAGTTDFLKVGPDPILTTAPDWSDVFQLVNRYNTKKGGQQEFAGVWFHPVEGARTLTFSIERVGHDKITVKEEEVRLERYLIRLRSGAYGVWVDNGGRVIRIVPQGAANAPVVLEGYQESTRDLVP